MEQVIEYAMALAQHLPNADPYTAAELSKVAKSLHRTYEAECNGELTPRQQARQQKLERRADELAREMGATGIVLQGDPRGAPVFIICPDGYANDWGQRGITVAW